MDATDLADDLLVRGLDDWVMLVEVEALVRRSSPDAGLDQVIRETVDLVETLSSAGLIEVGDVLAHEPGFVAWNLSRAQTVARVSAPNGSDQAEVWRWATSAGSRIRRSATSRRGESAKTEDRPLGWASVPE